MGTPASIRYANGYWWLLNGINIYWSYAASAWFHTLIGLGVGTPTGVQATAYGGGVWAIVSSNGYLVTTAAVAPYSLYVVGGNGGAGGGTAGAAGGAAVGYGMFGTGAGASSVATGTTAPGSDGACGGGGAGGSVDASNNIYLPSSGGNGTLVGRVNGGAAGTATVPPAPGASTSGSQTEWGGSGGGGGAYVLGDCHWLSPGATTGLAVCGRRVVGGRQQQYATTPGAGSAGGNGEVEAASPAM